MREKPTLSLSAILTAALVFAAAACTKNEPAPPTQAPTAASTPAQAARPAAVIKAKPDVTFEVATDGDNLYYTKKELAVKSGQTVKIVFKNNASAASNLTHNLVIVKPGTEQQVTSDGMAAGDAQGWVAEGPDVIAHTPLTQPGSISSVIFVAPAPGDYPFICTFPGHAMTMKGALHVK